MKQTRLLMGMPITINILDTQVTLADINDVFALFKQIDGKFSPYKKTSEVSRLNRKELVLSEASEDMKEVLALASKTKQESNGYFDVYRNGVLDPSGLVKGWAIQKAADLLKSKGFQNFFVDAGGDIQASGVNAQGESWKVGIRNPFNHEQHVKTIRLTAGAVATSGTAVRGGHIYDPHTHFKPVESIVSISVIASSIYDADRFATAAFAMGKQGIHFVERRKGLEGYMIDGEGTATYTSGFNNYA